MNKVRNWVLAGKPMGDPLLRTKTGGRGVPSRAAEEESFADIEIRREAIRLANHRLGDRHRLHRETVEIVHDGTFQSVGLVNLSAGGAMIEGADGLKLWDRLSIRVENCGEIDAVVRWAKGLRHGLEFIEEAPIEGNREDHVRMLQAIISRAYPDVEAIIDASSDVGATNLEPPSAGGDDEDSAQQIEREARHPVLLSGHIHYEHDSIPVRLRNISDNGALIECGRDLTLGAELMLDLDKAGTFMATVNWTHGGVAGLRFHRTFDIHQFAAERQRNPIPRWIAPDYLRDDTAGTGPWTSQRK